MVDYEVDHHTYSCEFGKASNRTSVAGSSTSLSILYTYTLYSYVYIFQAFYPNNRIVLAYWRIAIDLYSCVCMQAYIAWFLITFCSYFIQLIMLTLMEVPDVLIIFMQIRLLFFHLKGSLKLVLKVEIINDYPVKKHYTYFTLYM